MRLLVFAVAAFGLLPVVFAVLARLPSGTSGGALLARGLVAAAVGALIIAVVRRSLRSLAEPPPPLPPSVDAAAADVVYECGVCGTRLRLEVAVTGKAPKHCGEEMEPRLVGR